MTELPRLHWRSVDVVGTAPVTPRMRRVTLAGEELGGLEPAGPGGRIKLAFPAPGRSRPPVPELSRKGWVFPPGEEQAAVRTYTIRHLRRSPPEIDVDFTLHAGGPAATWVRRARPGDRLLLTGPRPDFEPAADVDVYLLAGDESALPAISSIVEFLPPGARARVVLEVADAAEEQQLKSPAEVAVRWLHREPAGARPGALLEAAVRAEWPGGRVAAWVAAESGTVGRIRSHLRDERGLGTGRVAAVGYWKLGAALE